MHQYIEARYELDYMGDNVATEYYLYGLPLSLVIGRVDIVNSSKEEFYEIKSNTPLQIAAGVQQIKMYLGGFLRNSHHGGQMIWPGVSWLLPRGKAGANIEPWFNGGTITYWLSEKHNGLILYEVLEGNTDYTWDMVRAYKGEKLAETNYSKRYVYSVATETVGVAGAYYLLRYVAPRLIPQAAEAGFAFLEGLFSIKSTSPAFAY